MKLRLVKNAMKSWRPMKQTYYVFIALVEFNELINKIASLDLEFTCILILKTVVDNVFVTGPHFN